MLAAPELGSVRDVLAPLTHTFRSAGYTLYIVGGLVRDLAVGSLADDADLDLTTDAPPATIRRLAEPLAEAVWTVGEEFGTIGLRVAGRMVEVTTHRAEVYDPASRKPVVSFGSSLVEDLARRDFTVNAMAISLDELHLYDPYGGLGDLKQRRLRTPLSPQISFSDDPLRMMRAARFISRFGLEAEPELMVAARALAPRLAVVSVERIQVELERLLGVDDPTDGFTFLDTTGLLDQILPFLPAEPETRQAILAMASGAHSLQARRVGLFVETGLRARTYLRQLRYPNVDQVQMAKVVEALGMVANFEGTDRGVRRIVAHLGADQLEFFVVVVGDWLKFGSLDRDQVAATDLFLARWAELGDREDLTQLGAPLSGAEVMTHLDLEPGPLVGQALDFLRDHRMTHGPIDSAQAYQLLDQWWPAHQLT